MLTILLAVLVCWRSAFPLYMALWFARPLIVLRRHGCRLGAQDELRRVPQEHPAVPRLERRDLRLGDSRDDPAVLGWLLLGPVLMVSIYMAYRDIFHEA